jgi:hypothetical protein
MNTDRRRDTPTLVTVWSFATGDYSQRTLMCVTRNTTIRRLVEKADGAGARAPSARTNSNCCACKLRRACSQWSVASCSVTLPIVRSRSFAPASSAA